MSLLVIWEILGLFVKTLTADGKCSLRNRNNLLQPIQTQLYKEEKFFLKFFSFIYEIYVKLWIFWKKKRDLNSLFISEITNCKRHGCLNV